MGEQRPVHRPRRSPHGERGLKFFRSRVINAEVGRSPHGERGLKSLPSPLVSWFV